MNYLSVIFAIPFLIAALEIEVGGIEQTFHDEYDTYVSTTGHQAVTVTHLDTVKNVKFPFGFSGRPRENYSLFLPLLFSAPYFVQEYKHTQPKAFILYCSLLI